MTATAIEIFAGCGGTSTGLLDAGIAVKLGVDYNKSAIRTFDFNHGYRGARGLVADLRQVSGESLRLAAGIRHGRLKLLAGGPPCQPFSVIGKREALNDPRGDLVLEYVRLLIELEPEAFIFENVPHLATVSGGLVFELLLEQIHSAGYAFRYAVLNAADYGVPQMRKRLVIVGVRGSHPPPFPPAASHGELTLLGQRPYVTCRVAIGDLPDVTAPEASRYSNHEPTSHSESMLAAFRVLKPGTRDRKSHHDRLHPDKTAYTLRAGSGNFSPLRPVHYEYDRVISVRESARLQTFTDDFAWPHDVPRLQQYRQVGNAVPPRLAAAVGLSLASSLGWSLDLEATRGEVASRETLLPLCREQRDEERKRRIRGASLGLDKRPSAR